MRVLVGTPAYGGQVTAEYTTSIIELNTACQQAGIQLDVLLHTGESLITRARNDITSTFMRREYDTLLWIDADIGFSVAQAARLIHSPHGVTAGVYPLKRLNWDRMQADEASDLKAASIMTVINHIPDAEPANGYVPVLDAGTGFMAVKSYVFAAMKDKYPELEYEIDEVGKSGIRYAFYDTMIEDNRYLSEDYAFCRRWQKLGGLIWADVASGVLNHQGTYVYGPGE